MSSYLTKIKHRCVSRLGYGYENSLHLFGLDRKTYRQARGARIVLYHGVCPGQPTKFNTLFVTIKTWIEHLSYYKKYFHLLSLDDYFEGKMDPHRFNLCITFDDGFANNYQYVLPLLEQMKIPATFFVTAIGEAGYDFLWNDFLGLAGFYGPSDFYFNGQLFHKSRHNRYVNEKGEALSMLLRQADFQEKAALMEQLAPLVPFRNKIENIDYWQLLNKEQLIALSRSPYAQIGAHGYYHNDLSAISLQAAEQELKGVKTYLENLCEKEIKSLSFPYGAYHQEVVDIAKKTGYTQLLATDFCLPSDAGDPALRERMTINPFLSTSNQLYALIKGRYR